MSNENTKTHICVTECVKYELVKDGKVIWSEIGEGHTWNATGLNQIAKWITNQTATIPTSIGIIYSGGTIYSTITTRNIESNTIAVLTSSFSASGALASIGTFLLMGASNLTIATKTATSFTKPDGFSLVVSWRNTLSST